jgi:hypothetical protein
MYVAKKADGIIAFQCSACRCVHQSREDYACTAVAVVANFFKIIIVLTSKVTPPRDFLASRTDYLIKIGGDNQSFEK